VQDVFRFDERRIVAGRVDAGTLRAGDRILFTPGGRQSTVKTIERWQGNGKTDAQTGESIGITLAEQVFVERGAVGSPETEPPFELARFRGRLFWMGHEPLVCGRPYKLKLATQEVDCRVETIHKVIDAASLAEVQRPGEPDGVRRYEVGEVTLHTREAVAFDVHGDFSTTGRFVVVDRFDVAGGGIVLANGYPRRTSDRLHKSTNIFWTTGKVTRLQRALRNGHPGCVIWLTGLSASGKSTIADEMERRIFNRGGRAYVLDGDKMRHGLCADLGFSPEDRKENVRRVGEVAKLFADSGAIVVTAFISPYRADRDAVRRILGPDEFLEVFVNAPLEICEQRDPKGLYAKARSGAISDFTGISSPYEPPLKPDLELRTDLLSLEECVGRLIERLDLLQAKATSDSFL